MSFCSPKTFFPPQTASWVRFPRTHRFVILGPFEPSSVTRLLTASSFIVCPSSCISFPPPVIRGPPSQAFLFLSRGTPRSSLFPPPPPQITFSHLCLFGNGVERLFPYFSPNFAPPLNSWIQSLEGLQALSLFSIFQASTYTVPPFHQLLYG